MLQKPLLQRSGNSGPPASGKDIGPIGSNMYYLQGFSGYGLEFTGMAGKLAAEAIAGQEERFDVFLLNCAEV
jgi:glycine/D-amino acid oxidase-like deaminating enzyme